VPGAPQVLGSRTPTDTPTHAVSGCLRENQAGQYPRSRAGFGIITWVRIRLWNKRLRDRAPLGTPHKTGVTTPVFLCPPDHRTLRQSQFRSITATLAPRNSAHGHHTREAATWTEIASPVWPIPLLPPRLGGLALARLLLARVHPVPVVLIGAGAPRARLAAVPYVPKPFALEHLLRVIADVLARSRARRGTGHRGEAVHPRVGG
jgi:hypothetical protein